MSARGRSLFVAVVVSLSFAALAAIPASAGMSYDVFIDISNGPPAFNGKVLSDNEFCYANRPVKVKRVEHGPDPSVGSGETDADGDWKIKVKVKTHAYYAKAPKYGSASLGIECKAAKSDVLAAD